MRGGGEEVSTATLQCMLARGALQTHLTEGLETLSWVPTPPLKSPPPCNSPPLGGEPSPGPKSIENLRRRRHRRKFLQGTKADLHCDTLVPFCGATPPPPMGGTVTW